MEGEKVQKINIEDNSSFPTAAIVVIAVGGYLLIFIIIMTVRKICLSNGKSFCPSWCSELCLCSSCSGGVPCQAVLDDVCTCCGYPNKRSVMDKICPTKEWCDDAFCCCLTQEPEGRCLCCDSDETPCSNSCKNCCNLDEVCGFESGKDLCADCKCQCCAQPETCDCCCIEIKLSSSSQRARQASMPGGYNNDGYMMNQMVTQQPPYNNQPGYGQAGYGPSQNFYSQGNFQQPSRPSFQSDYNPSRSSNGAYGQQPHIARQSQQSSFSQSTRPDMFSTSQQPGPSGAPEQMVTQWSRPGVGN